MNHTIFGNQFPLKISNDNNTPQPASGLARMRDAITEMAINLQIQQEAVSTFRSNIKGLRHEINLLGVNMRLFNSNLRSIRMEPLGRKARRLAALMATTERAP